MTKKKSIGKSAAKGEQSAKDLASSGGKARAAKLTAEERSEIARKAAQAKWGTNLPQVTHGDADHPLRIGNIEIPCYVLDNDLRVITHRGLQGSLSMAVSGGASETAAFLLRLESKGLYCQELAARVAKPIEFRPVRGGRTAFGYEATILPDICDLILEARHRDLLNDPSGAWQRIADRCEILVRGLARVGIIALVDEATGYQEVRDKLALQEILDQYLLKEFAAWAKRFPDEFYQQIFRLRNWQWKGIKVNRPQCVAQYTKNIVYARLAPGILKELETRNPRLLRGSRLAKHHQFLTEDIGHPALAMHLHAAIGLMRAGKDWVHFMSLLNDSFPIRSDTRQLPLFNDEDFENT